MVKGRHLIALLLALISAASVAVTAWAAWTPYDCEGSPSYYNVCSPPDDKYARAALDYSITGGNGYATDWIIHQRPYQGSTGGNTGPKDRWRLEWAHDWALRTSGWVWLGAFSGPGSWFTNTAWPSWDFTWGSQRTVVDATGIALTWGYRHEFCVWQPIGGNQVCTGPLIRSYNLENHVYN